MKLKNLLFEFSYSRGTYKDHLEHLLIGAIGEFYKAEHALANSKRTWVGHWLTETENLLEEFAKCLQHTVKGCRSRHKAVAEVLKIIKSNDKYYRRVAQGIVCRDFKQQLVIPIPPEATNRFFELVDEQIKLNL